MVAVSKPSQPADRMAADDVPVAPMPADRMATDDPPEAPKPAPVAAAASKPAEQTPQAAPADQQQAQQPQPEQNPLMAWLGEIFGPFIAMIEKAFSAMTGGNQEQAQGGPAAGTGGQQAAGQKPPALQVQGATPDNPEHHTSSIDDPNLQKQIDAQLAKISIADTGLPTHVSAPSAAAPTPASQQVASAAIDTRGIY